MLFDRFGIDHYLDSLRPVSAASAKCRHKSTFNLHNGALIVWLDPRVAVQDWSSTRQRRPIADGDESGPIVGMLGGRVCDHRFLRLAQRRRTPLAVEQALVEIQHQ